MFIAVSLSCCILCISIFASHKVSLRLNAKICTTVGWLYVDTIEILECIHYLNMFWRKDLTYISLPIIFRFIGSYLFALEHHLRQLPGSTMIQIVNTTKLDPSHHLNSTSSMSSRIIIFLTRCVADFLKSVLWPLSWCSARAINFFLASCCFTHDGNSNYCLAFTVLYYMKRAQCTVDDCIGCFQEWHYIPDMTKRTFAVIFKWHCCLVPYEVCFKSSTIHILNETFLK